MVINAQTYSLNKLNISPKNKANFSGQRNKEPLSDEWPTTYKDIPDLLFGPPDPNRKILPDSLNRKIAHFIFKAIIICGTAFIAGKCLSKVSPSFKKHFDKIETPIKNFITRIKNGDGKHHCSCEDFEDFWD